MNQSILGIERRVSVVAVDVAMELVGSRLGDHIGSSTGRETFLHVKVGSLGVDCLNASRRRDNHHVVGQPEKHVRGSIYTRGIDVLRQSVSVSRKRTVWRGGE